MADILLEIFQPNWSNNVYELYYLFFERYTKLKKSNLYNNQFDD